MFFILFVILAFGAASLGKMVMVTTAPGEIFGGWQKVLSKIKNEFWYKRLGGCATCTRQTVAEITFAGLVIMWQCRYGRWIFGDFHIVSNCFLSVGVYLLFCSMALYFGAMIEYEKKKVEAIENEYPDEKIIKQAVK